MLQAQARSEDQAVQLHEKLEAKRAATHAEKVSLLDSKGSAMLSPSASKRHYSLCCSLAHSHDQSPNQAISYLMKSMFWVCVSTLCMGGPQWGCSSKLPMANACDQDQQLPDGLFCFLSDGQTRLRVSLCNCLAVQVTCRNNMCQDSAVSLLLIYVLYLCKSVMTSSAIAGKVSSGGEEDKI